MVFMGLKDELVEVGLVAVTVSAKVCTGEESFVSGGEGGNA